MATTSTATVSTSTGTVSSNNYITTGNYTYYAPTPYTISTSDLLQVNLT